MQAHLFVQQGVRLREWPGRSAAAPLHRQAIELRLMKG